MNRRIKEAIKAAFEAPTPIHKQEFLRNVPIVQHCCQSYEEACHENRSFHENKPLH